MKAPKPFRVEGFGPWRVIDSRTEEVIVECSDRDRAFTHRRRLNGKWERARLDMAAKN